MVVLLSLPHIEKHKDSAMFRFLATVPMVFCTVVTFVLCGGASVGTSVSAADKVILSALQQAVDNMNRAEGKPPMAARDASEGNECSSLDGPFCSFINYDHFGLSSNPFSTGRASAKSFETQIKTSLSQILSALNIEVAGEGVKPADGAATTTGADDEHRTVNTRDHEMTEERSQQILTGRLLGNEVANSLATATADTQVESTSADNDVRHTAPNIPSEGRGHQFREEIPLQLSTIEGVVVKRSSVFLNREAHLAIDGVNRGDWPDVSHTYSQHEAWWQLTLPEMTTVSSIRVWNRRDGGAAIRNRIFPFWVLLSDAATPFSDIECPNPKICNSLADAKALATKKKYFISSGSCRVEEGKVEGREMCIWELDSPTPTRHVRIQLVKSNHLNLAEVEIMVPVGQVEDIPAETVAESSAIRSTLETLRKNRIEGTLHPQMLLRTLGLHGSDEIPEDMQAEIEDLMSGQHDDLELQEMVDNDPILQEAIERFEVFLEDRLNTAEMAEEEREMSP